VYGNIAVFDLDTFVQYLHHLDAMGSHCARTLWPLNREDTDKCSLTIRVANRDN